ncbi:hypothetical protein RQM47_12770 [Rubrivirga sp. S365]|uniref:hypothetical protein n=1 Tax=Rubrivirga sp. S365 TaxID=3076080 RepID=UPI0028CA3671|nr:hypothetical protein [Rubrivirga sp. S365]MDT7857517.1 hypothetical protein [Rubrivirga sp. S365]
MTAARPARRLTAPPRRGGAGAGRLPLALAVVLAACAPAPPAGPGAAAPDAAAPPGLFGDARALAVGGGALWVVDGAESAVVALTPDGRVVGILGGAGTGDGALLDPTDVDPTNGQAVFVADPGSGTVTHFTATGRAAETVAVPDVDPARAGQAVGPALRDLPRGRPTAVAAAPDGALYVVEAGRGLVLRLNAQRGVERVLGGPAAGGAALRRPVGLAVGGDGTLYVADRGRGGVQAFDPFGAPGRFLPAPDGGPVAVGVAGDSLVVVAPRAVAVWGRGGEPRVLPWDGAAPLVDAALVGGGVVGLTRTALVRVGG